MIKTLHIDSTILAYTPIDNFDGSSRREKEKQAISAILCHIEGTDTSLTHDTNGAPHLADKFISISHSRRLAVVAIDRHRPIGVDAEEWRQTLSRVKDRFLNSIESEYIISRAHILKAWTAKEAIYKLVGSPAVDFSSSIHISYGMVNATVKPDIIITLSYLLIDDTQICLATND